MTGDEGTMAGDRPNGTTTGCDRRTALRATGTGLAALLAGCAGSDSQPTTTDTETTDAATTTEPATTTDAETTTAAASELKRRTREFLGLLADGSFGTAHERFGPTAAEQISEQRLEQVWTGLEDQLGPFRSVSGLETTEQGEYDVVTGVADFRQGQREIVVAFGAEGISGFRIRRVSADWSPPEYADRSSFTEREVTLQATDGCTLGGTLTVPTGVENAPGVVVVHGQGPNDRDGTVGPNKPYKDLAWGLASRGVAVLRYDKRTQACDVNFAEVTIQQAVTDDALTAVERLRETDIVADDVVVAGHSIGGTLAPRIAERDGDLAGVVMLAALARSAPDAIVDQNEYLVERDGTVTAAEERQLEQARELAETIRTLDIADDEVPYLGGDEYWRTLAEAEPVQTAKRLDVPWLFLQGERDYQVTVEDDLALWRQALGDESNATFRQYPTLNHLFMPGTGKPSPEEYFERNHVGEAVVADIASFAERVTSEQGTEQRTTTK
jgi:hypothetical protein